jgi:NAD(P)-dependent dehydrogenase (short-subunit alcohol dehydrogenase family)
MSQETASLPALFDLTDRVAIVTGGAMGIGREIAQGFLEAGAQVVITSRDLDRAQCAAEELKSKSIIGLALDVRNPESVSTVFAEVSSRFGRIDILVNNAGGTPDAKPYSLLERKLEHWQDTIETNLTGPFLCTQAAARVMMPIKSGSIINIASIAGIVGRDRRMYEGLPMRPNLVDYAAAKAGVLGFTRDAAAELAPFGIRVNAVSPGGIERSQPTEFIHRYCDRTALGRMGRENRDMKGAVLLLASDGGAYVTGQNIVVDGGFTLFK